jgi:integrase/recombinase XerD
LKVAVKSTKEVNLTKRVKTPQDLRFCPFVISANGRVKPDYVLIVGKEQRHPEGAYYLEWREGGERVRQSVGRDASAAAARRHRQQQMGSKAAR